MSSRQITDHKVNGLNEALEVVALDAPGPGGANHHYMLNLPDWTRNPDEGNAHHVWDIQFQNGPIASPADVNGLTNEALLAVLIDRMRGFQYQRHPDGGFSDKPGKFHCVENAIALAHLEAALKALQDRTRSRLARGVEGSLQA